MRGAPCGLPPEAVALGPGQLPRSAPREGVEPSSLILIQSQAGGSFLVSFHPVSSATVRVSYRGVACRPARFVSGFVSGTGTAMPSSRSGKRERPCSRSSGIPAARSRAPARAPATSWRGSACSRAVVSPMPEPSGAGTRPAPGRSGKRRKARARNYGEKPKTVCRS